MDDVFDPLIRSLDCPLMPEGSASAWVTQCRITASATGNTALNEDPLPLSVLPPGGTFDGDVTVRVTVPSELQIVYTVYETNSGAVVLASKGAVQSPILLRFSPPSEEHSLRSVRRLTLFVQVCRSRDVGFVVGKPHTFHFCLLPSPAHSMYVAARETSENRRGPPLVTPLLPRDLVTTTAGDDDYTTTLSSVEFSPSEACSPFALTVYQSDGRGWTFSHREPQGESRYSVASAVSNGVLVAPPVPSPLAESINQFSNLARRSTFAFVLGSAFIDPFAVQSRSPLRRARDDIPVCSVEIISVYTDTDVFSVMFTEDCCCLFRGTVRGTFGPGSPFVIVLSTDHAGGCYATLYSVESRCIVVMAPLEGSVAGDPFRVSLNTVGWHVPRTDVFRCMFII